LRRVAGVGQQELLPRDNDSRIVWSCVLSVAISA
jgi:hypothetical protein